MSCPRCGYCSACGRSGYQFYPSYPYNYWYTQGNTVTYTQANSQENTNTPVVSDQAMADLREFCDCLCKGSK